MMETMDRKELLKRISELQFAAVDLNLYLDTHPDNQKALMDYNCFSEELLKLKNLYECKYGPLFNFGLTPSQYPWPWVNEPWPWESGE